jgi:hypothetical protein
MPFVGIDLELLAMAGPELLEGVARQPSVVGERLDIEVDVAAHLVSMAVLHEPPDDVEHLGDVVGRPGKHVRVRDADRARVLEEGLRVLGRDVERREPLVGGGEIHAVAPSVGGLVRHVADVGDVDDLRDPVALELGDPAHEVREQKRPQVPDVGVAVDGWAAGIDADVPVLNGGDLLDASGQGVVQAHGASSITGRALRSGT